MTVAKCREIKVIHLIPHDGIGGVEAAARSMAEANSLSCQFNLLLIAGKTLTENPQRIIESPFRSANNPLAHCLAVFRVLREKPDVLICSLWRSMLVGLLMKLLRPRTKIVCFLHFASTVHILDRILNNLMMRLADAVWADSKATLLARYRLESNKPTEVISFVVNRLQEGVIHDCLAPRLVFWGRLNRQKGLDRAVKFIAVLVKCGIDAQYEIWGPDDGEKEKLLSLVHEMRLCGHVHLMGPAKSRQISEIASENAFYLQLSRMEGMAMSVVEAMQHGLVPIVTPVGEIDNYCQAGRNAVVVDDPDDLNGATNELLGLLRDEKLYRSYQAAARATWARANLYHEDVCQAVARLVCNEHLDLE